MPNCFITPRIMPKLPTNAGPFKKQHHKTDLGVCPAWRFMFYGGWVFQQKLTWIIIEASWSSDHWVPDKSKPRFTRNGNNNRVCQKGVLHCFTLVNGDIRIWIEPSKPVPFYRRTWSKMQLPTLRVRGWLVGGWIEFTYSFMTFFLDFLIPHSNQNSL